MENKEEKIVEEKIEYKNRETGEVLTNPIDISYYKTLQNDLIIENSLLGHFDKLGKYVIEKNFLVELVKIKKYVVDSIENKYVLEAPYTDGEFKLTLVIEYLKAEDKKIATLRFIEFCEKSEGEQEILKTIVATYKDDADSFFIKKAFKVFNIVEKSELGDEIDEEVMLAILKRLKLIKGLKKSRIAMYDFISSGFVDEILAILRANPSKFSEYVLRKYGEGLLLLKDKISKDNYYILVKNMLVSILKSAIHQQKDENVSNLLNNAFKKYLSKYSEMHEELIAAPKEAIKKKQDEPKTQVESGGSSGNEKKKKAGKAKVVAKKAVKKSSVKSGEVYYFDNTKKQQFNDYKENQNSDKKVSQDKNIAKIQTKENKLENIYSLIDKISNSVLLATQASIKQSEKNIELNFKKTIGDKGFEM